MIQTVIVIAIALLLFYYIRYRKWLAKKRGSRVEDGFINYSLEELQEMMDDSGNLDLCCDWVASLPDNLTVRGNLDLRRAKIIRLPDNLTVQGSLNLIGAGRITSLPNNLTVCKNLNLRNTKITHLPDGLTVQGNLDLRDTEITHQQRGFLYVSANEEGK